MDPDYASEKGGRTMVYRERLLRIILTTLYLIKLLFYPYNITTTISITIIIAISISIINIIIIIIIIIIVVNC